MNALQWFIAILALVIFALLAIIPSTFQD